MAQLFVLRERWATLYYSIKAVCDRSEDHTFIGPLGRLERVIAETTKRWGAVLALETLNLITVQKVGGHKVRIFLLYMPRETIRRYEFGLERVTRLPRARDRWAFCDELENVVATELYWSHVAPRLTGCEGLILKWFIDNQALPDLLTGTDTAQAQLGVSSRATRCQLDRRWNRHRVGSQLTPTEAANSVSVGVLTPRRIDSSSEALTTDGGMARRSMTIAEIRATHPVATASEAELRDDSERLAKLEERGRAHPNADRTSDRHESTQRAEPRLRWVDLGKWKAWPVILTELQLLFRDKEPIKDIPSDQIVWFDKYGNDPIPTRLLKALQHHWYEGKGAPQAVVTVLRHHHRLHGFEPDSRIVKWAKVLMTRTTMTIKNGEFIHPDKVMPFYAGYVSRRVEAITKNDIEYLSSPHFQKVFAEINSDGAVQEWHKAIRLKKVTISDPLAYIASLPDGACSLEIDPEAQTTTTPSAPKDELPLILQDLEVRRERMNRQRVNFDKLPLREQIRLALGEEDAELYDKIKETTDDPAVSPLEDA